jgi:minor extracellular protease Epr
VRAANNAAVSRVKGIEVNMKGKFTTVFLATVLTVFATSSWAQVAIIDSTLDQVGGIGQSLEKQLIEPLPARLPKIEAFSLSQLPPIADTITEPLKALPAKLTIPTLDKLVEVELDDGWRAIERQWLMLSDEESLQKLQLAGVTLLEQQEYKALGLSLIRFTVPAQLDSKAALAKILPAAQLATLDRNHVFASQTAAQTTQAAEQAPTAINTQAKQAAMCNDSLTIGMLDTAIQLDHPALAQATIVSQDFVTQNDSTPRLHGTAIAGLLVGQSVQLSPLLPHAKLFAASVFYRQSDYAQGATMLHLVEGLNWLAAQDVKVVNMSLAGPDNQILALVIQRLSDKNMLIVAAAGNEGPAAPAMYPAAYPQVLAVSASDEKHNIYRWANQGDYIDFAALGVNVLSAKAGGGEGRESGTSLASPVVAAAVACVYEKFGGQSELILAYLAQQAVDLGATGKDPIFGAGLIKRAVEQ